MKILLVRPKFFSLVANLEPLGLEYLGGALREEGIPYEIWDEFQAPFALRFTRLRRKIRREGFTAVGFSVNANTADEVREKARALKAEFPRLTVLVGGPEAEVNYRDFCTEGVDFVCYDYGVETFRAMCASGFDPAAAAALPGLARRTGDGWVCNPPAPPVSNFTVTPDREPMRRSWRRNFIFGKGPHALVKASFSCPFRCAFCYCTMMNGGVYTQRPLSDVLADIEALEAESIWLVDDDFLLNRERVEEFCDLVLKRGVRKQFMAYARADFPAEHPDLLPLLYRAGFRDILVGLEAADDATLDAYHKETGRAVNEAAIRNLRAAGLVCNGLFVVSHAATREDFRNLLDFIRKNRLLWVVFGIFTPYKGSDAYEEYRDRLLTRKAKKLDGLHVTIRPEHMSKLMFYLRVVLLHAATYPKLLFRILRGTAYDTEKDGWW